MKSALRVLRILCRVLFAAALVFSAVYFWNLDQKLLDGLYALSQRVREHAQRRYGAL